jgi:hypothetical protein
VVAGSKPARGSTLLSLFKKREPSYEKTRTLNDIT